MTVKQLIEQLNQFDPETQVLGMCIDPSDYVCKKQIENIYLGNPFDSNGFSGVDNTEIDDMDDNLFDDEGEYTGEKVLLISLGDV
jgi:hypothetical protein